MAWFVIGVPNKLNRIEDRDSRFGRERVWRPGALSVTFW
jgi:hypothetical protein